MQTIIYLAIVFVALNLTSESLAHGNHGAEYECLRGGREVKIKRKSFNEKKIVCEEAGGDWVMKAHDHDHEDDEVSESEAAEGGQ